MSVQLLFYCKKGVPVTNQTIINVYQSKKKKKQQDKLKEKAKWPIIVTLTRHLHFTMISLSQFNDQKRILFKTASFADLK